MQGAGRGLCAGSGKRPLCREGGYLPTMVLYHPTTLGVYASLYHPGYTTPPSVHAVSGGYGLWAGRRESSGLKKVNNYGKLLMILTFLRKV